MIHLAIVNLMIPSLDVASCVLSLLVPFLFVWPRSLFKNSRIVVWCEMLELL
jgi:hypothetical protein